MNQVRVSPGTHGRNLSEAQRCSQSLNQARQRYADQVRLDDRREDEEASERQGGPIEPAVVVDHFKKRPTNSDFAPRVAKGSGGIGRGRSMGRLRFLLTSDWTPGKGEG
jgi:hypothetical protein